ncbi:MAG: hypothetical protein AB7V18_07615 [Pyrinomonadaceae bacterium]
MKKKEIIAVSVMLFLLWGTANVFAQGTSPAAKALHTWRSKSRFVDSQTEGHFIAIAVSAAKSHTEALDVHIAVGLGSKVRKLSNVSFSAQPLLVIVDASGKSVFQSNENPSVIRTPELENIVATPDGIVAAPHIKIPAPDGTVAVRIKFNDGSRDWNVILPILTQPSTAVLTGTVSEAGQLSRCQWHQGSCNNTRCGDTAFCVGCSTSANLDCYNCQMTCNDNSDCTPSMPKPVDCP